MSSEKVTLIYKATQEAQQRFEYFVTGLTGAMFTYITQTYTPQKLDLSAVGDELRTVGGFRKRKGHREVVT